jgi:hypothetical protein
MILKYRNGVSAWTGLSGSRRGPVAGCCKHGYEPCGFIKDELLVQCIDYKILKNNCSSGS